MNKYYYDNDKRLTNELLEALQNYYANDEYGYADMIFFLYNYLNTTSASAFNKYAENYLNDKGICPNCGNDILIKREQDYNGETINVRYCEICGIFF